MAGIEGITVIGLISSVITIIEPSRNLYDAATSVKGLHEAFRAVSNNIPLVLNILRDCKRIQEQADRDWKQTTDAAHKRELEESAEAVTPVMIACESRAKKLKDIFEKVVPGEDAHWLQRYRKAVQAVMPDKRRKVEDLMRDILEKLQLLHTNQFYKVVTDKRSEDLDGAIQQLSHLSPSLPEDDGSYTHHGSGPMNISTGTGTQHNYNQSGGSNNRQYVAGTQNFTNEEMKSCGSGPA